MISAKPNLPPWGRPEFMAVLGLMPPYTAEDVKQAYLTKVKTAHPDVGGDAAGFIRLQRAFERAAEYARLHPGCTNWIRSHVERYIRQQAIVGKLKAYGARIDIEQPGWLNPSFGADFSQLGEELVGIHLRGLQIGDDVLDYLVQQRTLLGKLRLLDLAHTNISDQGLQRLCFLTSLKYLDLCDTPITYRGLRVLRWLPALECLDLRGTSVGLWGRIKLRWFCPKVNMITRQAFRTAGRLTRRQKRTMAMVLNLLNASGARTTQRRPA